MKMEFCREKNYSSRLEKREKRKETLMHADTNYVQGLHQIL